MSLRDIAVNAIGGVLATAIVAGTAAIWLFVPSLFESIASWLKRPVPMPMWLVALIGGGLLIAAIAGLVLLLSKASKGAAVSPEQNLVLSRLAASHPQNLSVAVLCRVTGLSALAVDSALDGLSHQGLVDFPMILGQDVEYYLTAKGRQFVIEHRLV